jgi:hypothetical protein
MRRLPALLLLLASSAGAQAPLVPEPAWQPTAPYVTAGQDEPGYRNWYMAAPWHAGAIKSFNDYLTTWGVGGIVPTWQLLRTASDWQKCGAQPFELPPTADWPNVVQTLRYIHDKVIPAVGPVEPVSAYRNAALNQCAGGAPESAHRYFQAIDLVTLRPTTREALIHDLCSEHSKSGGRYGVGLGFYPFLRFHIDSRKFRKWGAGNGPEAAACLSEPASLPPPIVNAPQPATSQPQTAAPNTVPPGATPPKI